MRARRSRRSTSSTRCSSALPMMHVTGDRQVEHGLSTVGYDDEGVAAQTWDIVRDGVLVGYQLDRQMAHKQGFGRSNGCAFADAAGHVPLQRMPNVSLQPRHERRSRSTICSPASTTGSTSSATRAGRSTCSATTSSSPVRSSSRIRGGKIVGQVKDVAYQSQDDRLLERDGGGRRAVDLRARRRVQLRQGAARPDCTRHARLSGGALPADQHPQHRAGGALITLQETIDRVLRLSKADACIVIARRVASVNIRWAHNTVTTNGDADEVSAVGRFDHRAARRFGDAARTFLPSGSRRSCASPRRRASAVPRRPTTCRCSTAPGEPADWQRPPADADIHVFDPFVPQLAAAVRGRAAPRHRDVRLRGVTDGDDRWLATSTGLRRRHTERIGKVEITAKTPDFARSSWVGPGDARFPRHRSARHVRRRSSSVSHGRRGASTCRPGHYEVLLEPSCAADLAISAYCFMTRRDADEGRSPYSKPGRRHADRRAAVRRCDDVFGSRGAAASTRRRSTTASIPAAPRRSSTTACARRERTGCATASPAAL